MKWHNKTWNDKNDKNWDETVMTWNDVKLQKQENCIENELWNKSDESDGQFKNTNFITV